MVFHWSLSDSKSPQVFKTLLSILLDLNNVVVRMASTRPPTSKSSSPLTNPLVTVANALITIGIIVTFMFHSFYQFPNKVEVLILLFTLFQFLSEIAVNHPKKARAEIWPKRSDRRNNTKTTKMRTKSPQ